MTDDYTIDTPEKAAWAMRKYRRIAQRMEENRRLADAEHERIAAWLERVNTTLEGEIDFFDRHLVAYGMQQRAEGRKSVDLPDGVIKTRSTAENITLDKSAFVQWALETDNQALLRTSYAPDMSAIKSAAVIDGGKVINADTGEVIPHAEITPSAVSVTITPDLDAVDLEEDDDE